GGCLPRAGGGAGGRVAGAGRVPGALWRRGSVSAGARGAGATLSWARGGASRGPPQPAGAHLAGPDAGAAQRRRTGGSTAPGSGSDAATDAAGNGRGPGDDHGRAAARAGVGGFALERCGDPGPTGVSRTAA